MNLGVTSPGQIGGQNARLVDGRLGRQVFPRVRTDVVGAEQDLAGRQPHVAGQPLDEIAKIGRDHAAVSAVLIDLVDSRFDQHGTALPAGRRHRRAEHPGMAAANGADAGGDAALLGADQIAENIGGRHRRFRFERGSWALRRRKTINVAFRSAKGDNLGQLILLRSLSIHGLRRQAQGRQGGAGRSVGGVVETANAESLGHLHEHRPIVHVNHFLRLDRGDVQRNAINVGVRLAAVDKAGGDEQVDERRQVEGLDAMDGQLAALVADGGDFQPVASFRSRINWIISGKGFDCSNMNLLKASGENGRGVQKTTCRDIRPG